jgi:hypothetical protein
MHREEKRREEKRTEQKRREAQQSGEALVSDSYKMTVFFGHYSCWD